MVPVATLAGTIPRVAPDARPVICGGHLVSVVEVLAPAPMATSSDTDTATALELVASGDREGTVMEWLTDPAAGTDRLATAKGEDVVALLAATGHGHVSARVGRRILATMRAVMSEDTLVD